MKILEIELVQDEGELSVIDTQSRNTQKKAIRFHRFSPLDFLEYSYEVAKKTHPDKILVLTKGGSLVYDGNMNERDIYQWLIGDVSKLA